MPVIKKPELPKEKKQSRTRLDAELLQEIEAYYKWADLPTVDYFLEQAALMALKKDKQWKKIVNEDVQTRIVLEQ